MTKKQLLREYERVDYSSSLIKEGTGEHGGRFMLRGIIQRANTKNQNNRIYPRQVLVREMENYMKAVRENRAVGELDHPDCVIPGTYILSSSGWRPIEEVREGDLVATISQGGYIEYQSVLRKIDQAYHGKMVRIFNSKGTLDQLLTPNHRVMLWDRSGGQYYVTASDFARMNAEGDSRLSHSSMHRAGTWVGDDPDNITLPGGDYTVPSELWAAFLGIWLAEGHADGAVRESGPVSNNVVITQVKEEERTRIRALITEMGLPFRENDKSFCLNLGATFHSYFHKLGNSHTKRIPEDVKAWSPRLLSVLLEWMLIGDGKNRKGYRRQDQDFVPIVKEYATVSRRLADDVQEVMVKLGYGATIHTYQPGDRPAPDHAETGRMILEENSQPIHIVYGHVSRGVSMDSRFVKTETVDYDGRVLCVTTPNGNWLMRTPSGQVCWTGNSSTVSLDRVSHIVRETEWKGDEVHGLIEVLDTPKGQILKTLINSGVTIGISSRGVGSTSKNESGCDMVQDDFNLVAFDIVSEPSTPGAYLHLREGVEFDPRSVPHPDRVFRIVNSILTKKGIIK